MEKLNLEIKNANIKKLFLEELVKRYDAEHGKQSIDEKHKTWWLQDQGVGRAAHRIY